MWFYFYGFKLQSKEYRMKNWVWLKKKLIKTRISNKLFK